MATVAFHDVHKRFGSNQAVANLNLEIGDGEFLVMVGPSGCGKSTTLRMLAGLEQPTSGHITIGERVVNKLPPKARNVAVVFQNYALYPHLTVRDNLAFGMRIRHEPRDRIRKQVETIACQLELTSLLDRKPAALSGGERQRVAVGRALLRQPQVFLLDEPLSNLDATLRTYMRGELSRLHAQHGVTTFYVTHDQIEAMTLGDRIAVMRNGRLQQVAMPETLYDHPVNLFVAGFIGSPKMNFFPARLLGGAQRGRVEVLSMHIETNDFCFDGVEPNSTELLLGIRPEDVLWGRDCGNVSQPHASGTVETVEPVGSETYVTARVQDTRLVARFPPRSGVRVGDQVELVLRGEHIHLFKANTGLAVERRCPISCSETSESRSTTNSYVTWEAKP
jgi:multiple sugar transport system ATP-binding protein